MGTVLWRSRHRSFRSKISRDSVCLSILFIRLALTVDSTGRFLPESHTTGNSPSLAAVDTADGLQVGITCPIQSVHGYVKDNIGLVL
jgi:hypothetical protein